MCPSIYVNAFPLRRDTLVIHLVLAGPIYLHCRLNFWNNMPVTLTPTSGICDVQRSNFETPRFVSQPPLFSLLFSVVADMK